MYSMFEDVESRCYIVATHHPYHPIRIDDGVYGIHGTSELIYDRFCNSKPDRIPIAEDRPYSVEYIPKGCPLLVNGKSYPGAVRVGSKTSSLIYQRKILFPPIFELQIPCPLTSMLNPSQFNLSSIECSKMDVDQTILNEISERTQNEIDVIKRRLNSNFMFSSPRHLSPFNIVDLFNQSVLMIFTLVLTLLAVRRIPWLRFVNPVFIIEQAEGSEFSSWISPVNSFNPTFNQRLTSTALILTFLCLVSFVLIRNNFRRKFLRSVSGIVEDKAATRCLSILLHSNEQVSASFSSIIVMRYLAIS